MTCENCNIYPGKLVKCDKDGKCADCKRQIMTPTTPSREDWGNSMIRKLTPEEIRQRKEEEKAMWIPYRNARIREMIVYLLIATLLGIILRII